MHIKSSILLIVLATLFSFSCKRENNNEVDKTSESYANTLYEDNQYAAAVEAYSDLIRIDSTNGKYYYNRAYSLCQLNKDEIAVSDYLKAAELGYREVDSYLALGLLHATIIGDDSLAIYYLEKCLQIQPSNDDARRLLNSVKSQPQDVSL